jgi:Zn-dependent M28 family amino/carboxypeptidase
VLKCKQDSGHVFDRSVLFVAFTAEELGLLGSRYFVESELFADTKPLLNINMDMIGRSVKHKTFQAMVQSSTLEDFQEDTTLRESYVYLTAIGKDIRKYSDYASEIAVNDHPGFVVDRNPGLVGRLAYRGGSDHANFVKQGIPALVWFTGLHPDYHTPRDTPDKIDYSNLERITDVIFKTTLRIISR